MRVFVAGATGAIGSRLVPMLVQSGYQVTGMTRSPGKVGQIRAAGATPVVADALDPDAVMQAVRQAVPEVIVHQLTAIPDNLDIRHFSRDFAITNRLRTEGLDHLIAAGRAVGSRFFVAQSYAGWPSGRSGGPVTTENDPLDPHLPRGLRSSFEAIRYLESTVRAIPRMTGVVLRYGGLYGPGNTLGAGGAVLEQVRKRRVPIIGGGTGIWSFIHVDDAASATVKAIHLGASGIYNVVDDEPAKVAEWLTTLAAVLGAKPPLHLPAWLGRLAIGEHGVFMMTQVRGASNAKIKRELSWQPRWSTWREGFRKALGDEGTPNVLGASATPNYRV